MNFLATKCVFIKKKFASRVKKEDAHEENIADIFA